MSHSRHSLPNASHHTRLVIGFLAVSLAVIVLASLLLGTLMASYVTRHMLERDTVITTDFLNSLVQVHEVTSYFYGDTQNPNTPEMEEFFAHVARLPDVIGAHVYGGDRSVLWSSDPALVGRSFRNNEELEAAMRGELQFYLEDLEGYDKPELRRLSPVPSDFIEAYLPIWSADKHFVVGVVEVYKSPQQLIMAVHRARSLAWTAALLGGLVLYGGLLVVVIYAARVLREKEAQLVEAERLAAVGEMASTIAHGLHNPLAAIRSNAELALEEDLPAEARAPISDIVDQSDRLEGWIRTLLGRTRE